MYRACLERAAKVLNKQAQQEMKTVKLLGLGGTAATLLSFGTAVITREPAFLGAAIGLGFTTPVLVFLTWVGTATSFESVAFVNYVLNDKSATVPTIRKFARAMDSDARDEVRAQLDHPKLKRLFDRFSH